MSKNEKMIKPKEKKCKECGELSLYRKYGLCLSNCYPNWLYNTDEDKEKLLKAIKTVKKETKTKWQKEKTKRKKELMTLQDWIKITQQVVNKYIRERDKNELNCISCGKLINGVRHASHYLSAGNNYSVRFNTDNIWVSCYKCNVMLSGNQLEYRIRLIEKIGIERVEYLESISKDTVKYSVEQLQNIIKEFKEKIKELDIK